VEGKRRRWIQEERRIHQGSLVFNEAADNSISCFSMFCVCREIQFSDVRMLAKWGVIYIY